MLKRLTVKYPFDLRSSLNEKKEIAERNGNWTAFVNNRGTVAHVIHPEEDWIIRLRFVPNLKNCSQHYMERRILFRVEHRLII